MLGCWGVCLVSVQRPLGVSWRHHENDRRTSPRPAVERKDAMSRSLPRKIVTAVETLAEELAEWCVVGRDQSLGAHEEAVLDRVRKVMPLLLGAVVEQATSGLDVR